MKTTFGAKLITKPESFFLKTDSIEDKIHIKNVFYQLQTILNIPNVKKLSKEDSLELIRKKRKGKFWYEINYKSPDLPEKLAKGIKICSGITPQDFHYFDVFYIVTHLLAIKTNKCPKFIESISQYIKRVYQD